MALKDLLDDSSCFALPVSRPSDSSSCLLLVPAKFSTLAADARLDDRFHQDLVGSTTCPSQTVGQGLTRRLFVREPVAHGDKRHRLPCQCAAPASNLWFSVLSSSWDPGVASSHGTWSSVITDISTILDVLGLVGSPWSHVQSAL